ncbi:unnamed protein product [Effrenium voratum]|uniref:Uncharacterized protein n=1 Tax=Effrenium voratum TaxID=2562239 RepID=A0AA36J3Z0_9DINO|nr:unnamed protein product [Effrenium voratum]CAJ1457501.1 unnamed protein product [Effrenium voratum]
MGCGASTDYSAEAYAKFKNDAEDKQTLILRSFYRAISNSFHDMENKKKGVDVRPIITQSKGGCDPKIHDTHKGMSTLEELIAAVFGANVGGVKRDENAKISLEVWKELCRSLKKECKDFWSHEDEKKLVQRITEMSIKAGQKDMSWCKKVRVYCRPLGDDGKFFFAKVESTQEEGILTFPAKPVEEQDGVSPAAWINYRYGKADDSKEKLQIDVLTWEMGAWSESRMEVDPGQVFDL